MDASFSEWGIVKLIKNTDYSVQEIIEKLQAIPDKSLSALDAAGANLLFYAVQRLADSEAVQICAYLTDEKKCCDAAVVDTIKQTAIFFAARDGNCECVKFLVERGCNPSQTDDAGQTALFYACREGRDEVVSVLVSQFGLDVNARDTLGQTALFYAAREGQKKTVELLVEELGADPSVRDWQKKCSHTYAQKRNHSAVAAFLKSACANVVPDRRFRQEDIHRQRFHLQRRVDLKSGSIWLFASIEEINKFEDAYPTLALWPRDQNPTYAPTDAFRYAWAYDCLEVIHLVSNYKDGWLFSKPVDVKTWNCPDYYSIVKEPRDFSILKRKLKHLEYCSVQTFMKDLTLIFTNCFLYNSESSSVHQAGLRVQTFCNSVVEEKNIQLWVEKEKELIEYLKSHNLPIEIGPEFDDVTTADWSADLRQNTH